MQYCYWSNLKEFYEKFEENLNLEHDAQVWVAEE
jgi:hypothetical protein